MGQWKVLPFMVVVLCLAGCKIVISVPNHGLVQSQSGAWVCHSGDSCTIDVVDALFDETFEAIPESGYQFSHWRKDRGYFCGGTSNPCRILTTLFAGNEALEALLAADLTFYLEPVFHSNSASSQHTIATEGGTYEFVNGVVLDVPPGALDQPVTIDVSDLPEADVSAILESQTGAVSEKRYLGGFSVNPDVDFKKPVTATFSVEAPLSYETLMQIEVERSDQKYWFEKTALEYRPDKGEVVIEVSHFSDVGTAAVDNIDPGTLDDLCTDPRFNSSLSICEDLDPLQPKECLLKPADRPAGTECCREGRITVRSEAIDFVSNRASEFCQMVSDSVDVTFHDCPLPDGGVPTESSDICELSAHCPQDEFLGAEVQLTPPGDSAACFSAGEKLNLEVAVTDGDGNSLNNTAVQWRSADSGVAIVSPAGQLAAVGNGTALVEASYRQSCKDFSDTVAVPVIDLNGTWKGIETADETDCGEGVNTYFQTVTIQQSGNQILIFWPEALNVSGTKSNCNVTGMGGEREDGGISLGSGQMQIAADGSSIQGSGSWTWRGTDPDTGQQISCSGTSQYLLTR
jgi:hypothetical protein